MTFYFFFFLRIVCPTINGCGGSTRRDRIEIKDIYAAGDIARFPYAPMGESTRIEHWRLAAQQGRIAAENMLHQHTDDQHTVSQVVPFFWSAQYDSKLRYVGHTEQWDEIFIDGDLDKPEFLAFYLQDNKIMAVAGVNRDRDIAAISELMRLQKMPDAAEIQDTSIDNSGNKVKAVEVEFDGNKEQYTANTFVLSCGSINSAALLLKSANEKHPDGLANSSGMVGRNLMLHNHSAIITITDKLNPTAFQKTLGFNDFYFGSPEHNYPLGQIQESAKQKASIVRC